MELKNILPINGPSVEEVKKYVDKYNEESIVVKCGMTSHAAVVARGMGKPCIVGAENLKIDKNDRKISNGQITVEEGDLISLDGSTGEIFLGEVELESAKLDRKSVV